MHKGDKQKRDKRASGADGGSSDQSDYYFDSYSHLGIHEEMIKDTVRTNTYRTAILENSSAFEGKVVLDVGCGTGILSFFAAQAGARKVYAVEASSMADHAQRIVDANGMTGRIEVLKQKMEDVVLPEQVDIIISEWMGYFLIYETMLDSVLAARDRWLRPGGMMFPSHARMFIAPICDDETWAERVDFWYNVYGIDMSVLLPFAVKCSFEEPMVETVPPHMQVGPESCIMQLDLATCRPEDAQVNSEFQCATQQLAHIHGFFSWFDVLFAGPQRHVTLSTSPSVGYTHWRQTIFYIDEPISVEQDTLIRGSIVAKPHAENHRFLNIDLSWSVGANTGSKKYAMR